VKIDQAAIGLPSAENAVDSRIIQRSAKMQPSSKILTAAYIIPRKHMSPSEPAK
jgi:hypothetical protein